MKPTVYVETSVVSYYTARPSRDILVLAHQELTRRWWEQARDRFELVISELVVLEAEAGDPKAAEERLRTLEGMEILPITPEHTEVSEVYVADLPLPEKAARDAIHLAVASMGEVDYLVTWNCAHIANALLRRQLAHINTRLNLSTPVICTPEEMLEEAL